jgi:hypothetical protein
MIAITPSHCIYVSVCFEENQRLLSNFLGIWWNYEKTSISAVGADSFHAECILWFPGFPPTNPEVC